MGYTAGVDVASLEFIDETEWNAYMGASGSLDTLKAVADKVPGCTQSIVTGTRALGTDYQNDSGHARFVTVTVDVDTGDSTAFLAYVEANDTTPDVIVVRRDANNDSADIEFACLSFMVPPGYYYKVAATAATVTLYRWVEWDFHG